MIFLTLVEEGLKSIRGLWLEGLHNLEHILP